MQDLTPRVGFGRYAALLGVAAVVAGCGSSASEFNAGRWKASVAHRHASREGMVDDLFENRLTRGMTPAQVRALLGGPDEADDGIWVYGIEEEPGFLTTYVSVLLTFEHKRLVNWDRIEGS